MQKKQAFWGWRLTNREQGTPRTPQHELRQVPQHKQENKDALYIRSGSKMYSRMTITTVAIMHTSL